MILQKYREDFYFFSGKASDISRQLAFAAIAVIWLFKKDTAGQLTVPLELIRPGILVVLALALDLLQYCSAALIWYFYYRSLEKKKVPETADTQHSVWLERPISFFFWAKIAVVILAYYYILIFLLRTFGMI
jgi:hypothetical protein